MISFMKLKLLNYKSIVQPDKFTSYDKKLYGLQ